MYRQTKGLCKDKDLLGPGGGMHFLIPLQLKIVVRLIGNGNALGLEVLDVLLGG